MCYDRLAEADSRPIFDNQKSFLIKPRNCLWKTQKPLKIKGLICPSMGWDKVGTNGNA